MLIQLLFKLLNSIIPGIDAKAYTSPTPIGRRLGGHDIVELQDMFLILDVSYHGKRLLLGYLQYM